MPIQAQVEGIGTLEFPDGTDPSVIQATVKQQIARKQPALDMGSNKGMAPGYTEKYLKGVAKEGQELGTQIVEHPIKSLITAIPAVAETLVQAGGQAIGGGAAALHSGLDTLTGNPATFAQRSQEYQKGLAPLIEPHTDLGKKLSSEVGAVFKPVSDVVGLAGKGAAGVSKQLGASPEKQKATEEITNALANAALLKAGINKEKIPEVAESARRAIQPIAERIAREGEEKAAIRQAEAAPKQAKIAQARSIGLKIPPSEGGGIVGKTLEGMSGKIQTEMAMSRDNAKIINRTVGKEIGLSDRQALTEGNIERLKQGAFKFYDKVKNVGRISADDQFKMDMEKIKDRTRQAQEDYPEDTNELIDKEIAKFNKESASSAAMLEKVKSLRQRAAQNMKALDAEKFELGIAQKKIATAMEDLIDRRTSEVNPELIKNFRNARTQLAKIYNVEDALGPNGNVSAAVLKRQLDRGVPLSGGLKAIAESYAEFPKVMRYVDNLGGHAPFSALDYLVGGVEAVAHPAGAAKVVGALAGRPIARSIIKSEAYQKAAIKPREQKPSLLSRTARKIAGEPAYTLKDVDTVVEKNTPPKSEQPAKTSVNRSETVASLEAEAKKKGYFEKDNPTPEQRTAENEWLKRYNEAKKREK